MTRAEEFEIERELHCCNAPQMTIKRCGPTPAPLLATTFPYSVTPLTCSPDEYDPQDDAAAQTPRTDWVWQQLVESSQAGQEPYVVVAFDDGTYTCPCKGFEHRGRCRHFKAAQAIRATYPPIADNPFIAVVAEIRPDAETLQERADKAMSDLFGAAA